MLIKAKFILLLAVALVANVCEATIKMGSYEYAPNLDFTLTCYLKPTSSYPNSMITVQFDPNEKYKDTNYSYSGPNLTLNNVPSGHYSVLFYDNINKESYETELYFDLKYSLKANDDSIEVKVPCVAGEDLEDVRINVLENDVLSIMNDLKESSKSVSPEMVNFNILNKPSLRGASVSYEDGFVTYHIEGEIDKNEDMFTYQISWNGYTTNASVYVSFKKELPIIKKVEVNDCDVSFDVSGGLLDYQYSIDDSIVGEGLFASNIPYGNHTVYIIDKNYCKSEIKSFYVSKIIQASSIITPNGDGINDIWSILNIENFSQFRIVIFNKRGRIIKEYINEYIPWDGTYNDIPLPSDDYWYTISSDETDTDISGHITLIRNE